MIRVEHPGLHTTVQDLGRIGNATYGVPRGGAYDPFALRAANMLVGNDEGAAGLEITLGGPTLLFEESSAVALTGSIFEAFVDERPIPMNETVRINAGARIRVGRASQGARCFLAVAGGIDVPIVLGSRSTFVPAGFGGLGGRSLRTGDTLVSGAHGDVPRKRMRPPAFEAALRVVSGPHIDAFESDALATLLASEWQVTMRADRTGIRLDGPGLRHRAAADADPYGVVPGVVQVPGDSAPIVLGPDGPATGGYAAIATVIAADTGLLAHARPSATLGFIEVTVRDAHAAWAKREHELYDSIADL